MPGLKCSLVPFLLWTLLPLSKHHSGISLLWALSDFPLYCSFPGGLSKVGQEISFPLWHPSWQLAVILPNFQLCYCAHLGMENTESRQGQSLGSPWKSCPAWMCPSGMIWAQRSCQRTPEAQEEVSGPCGLHPEQGWAREDLLLWFPLRVFGTGCSPWY